MFILSAAATLDLDTFRTMKVGYDRLATKLQIIIKSFSNANVYFLSNPETIKLRILYTRNEPSKRNYFIIRNELVSD
jgi:hypothetical protein